MLMHRHSISTESKGENVVSTLTKKSESEEWNHGISPYLELDPSKPSLVNATNSENFTPLDVAIMRGNVRAAAELIESGADVNGFLNASSSITS